MRRKDSLGVINVTFVVISVRHSALPHYVDYAVVSHSLPRSIEQLHNKCRLRGGKDDGASADRQNAFWNNVGESAFDVLGAPWAFIIINSSMEFFEAMCRFEQGRPQSCDLKQNFIGLHLSSIRSGGGRVKPHAWDEQGFT